MKDLKEIVEPLIRWFRENKRDLPWRQTKDPYAVWVSEIMLQQTRVEAVKPYYIRFLQTLPTVKDLANADEEVILKLWEGLGYYSRVRNMQKAAIQIMEDFGGVFPANQKDLLSLKGIGSYTAGAVGSIAFGLPIPAVDGNVLRVMSRITADASDISLQITKKEWESRLAEIMPQECAGDLNQALMELGAMVCLPNGAPKCGVCKGGEKAAHIRISERIFLRRWGENCDWQTPEKWLAFGTLGAAERTERHRAACYIAGNGHFRG